MSIQIQEDIVMNGVMDGGSMMWGKGGCACLGNSTPS